jgi:phage gpG-like protein
MSVLSLAEFAAELVVADHNLKVAETEVITAACAMVAERAKDIIGVPQPGWPPLSPETLKHKDGINSPLLETGELRDSITWNSDDQEGYVGTNDPKGRWQEFGTSRIPPRSFLGAAAIQMECEIDKMAERAVADAFDMGVFGEVLRGLKESGHKLRETAEDFNEMLQGGDDDRR